MASFRAHPLIDCQHTYTFNQEKIMKPSKFLALLALALVAVLLTTYPALAAAQRAPFTGTSTFGETLNAGEWAFLPGGNVLARGIVEAYHDVNTDPRVTGIETIVSNGNFGAAPSSPVGLAGYLWGTFHIENAGGTWDGTFTSEITEGGEYFYRGVAHGSGGYEGLVGHWDAYRNGHSGPFALSGWILEP
jgi:hypothetical protein